MDNIAPWMATTATAAAPQQQQQRARRKAAVSSAANVAASARREDLMLVPPDNDDSNGGGKENNGNEDRSVVPPAASANNVRELPPSDATVVGSSPPLLPFASTSFSTSSSSCSCSSPVVVVQKDMDMGHQHPTSDGSSSSDAGSGYGSSSSGGKHNNNKNGHNSKKKTALSAHAVEYLKNWMMSPEHVDHPYPTEDEKLRIMNETGIVLKQLTNWFVNNRKRYWKPKVEELRRQQTGDMGGAIAGSSPETTEVAAADRGDGTNAASTITASMTTGKTNADGVDGGARGVGEGEPPSQFQREDGNNNRRPAPSSHSSGGGGGKRRNKRPAPANEDDETTPAVTSTSGSDTSIRRAKKARGEVDQYPVIVDSVASANVANAACMRVIANGSCTSVVSDESAEEGGGARVGRGRGSSCGTEEESGDDTDEIGNVAVTNPSLEDPARAAGTFADSMSTPISSNVIGSKSGAIRGNHQQQVMMMINMEYSINPLDMDDNDDDLIQNNMAVDRTICCSSILPHSCSDPKNRGMLCALCSACRDWNLGEFCPWDLTGIIGDISTDNVLQATPQDPSTTSFTTSEDYGNGMSLTSLVTSSSRSGSTHSEDGSSAHYETSSTEEGGTTVVTKNSTVAEEAMGAAAGCIEPTVMADYTNFSVPQEISHSTSAADFMSSMADIESWD